MIEIRVGAGDLAHVRFAHDAVWETTAALNAVAFPHGHILHDRLRRRIPRHPRFDLQHLTTLTANHGWIPDVLGPTPTSAQLDPVDRLHAVAGTDPATAESDLAVLRRIRPEDPAARMTAEQYLDATATALAGFYRDVLEPLWERVDDIASADIAHHRAAIVRDGLAASLPAIHQNLRFAEDAVRIEVRSDTTVQASGRGVWFVPSVFRWPWFAVDMREQEPVISYAARGAGRVWEDGRPSDLGLTELLGRSRAEILRRLDVGQTTTRLARDLRLAPSTVSFHLSVMVTSGLLTSHREGRAVVYRRTLVGGLLVSGESALAHIS